ncbi:MAG: hypothetical protein AB3X44_19255 [Leptothrix sp. (in: b-proteobacteria)]
MRYAVSFFLLTFVIFWADSSVAAVASLDEDCRDHNNRAIPIKYDRAATVFAEARVGYSGPVIVINPNVYFVGRQTQQWLYQRQCVHIQQGHSVVREGEKGMLLADEESADCGALTAVAAQFSSSARTLRAAIESDVQRAIRDGNWRWLFTGPQRRISLDKCPG